MTLRACVPLCLALVGAQPGRLLAQTIKDVTEPPTRPAPARVASARPPDTSEASLLRHTVDSLRQANAALRFKVPPDSASRARYESAVNVTKTVLLGWFALVLFYLVWAVHRYVYNYGLSNREWKILYPEVYETWLDRLLVRIFGGKDYRTRRQELIEHQLTLRNRQQETSPDDLPAAPAAAITKPFDEPPGNPYQDDSFGLPPGTIRGILALTSLIMFVMVEGVNLHSPASLEGQFDGLVTVFEMVVAFYFGSRAVEVLQAKAAEQRTKETTAPAAAGVEAPVRPAPKAAAPQEPAPVITTPSPAAAMEQVLLPETRSFDRFANVVALTKDGGAAPAAQPAAQLTGMPLAKRVLTLTAAFETGRGFPDCFGTVAGNFDGQGLSFGALQWNIGQGSLQPLWKEMRDRHDADLRTILAGLYDEFCHMLDSPKDDQLRWALGIQSLVSSRTNTWRIADNWKNALQALGMSGPMVDIQVSRASSAYQIALGFCKDYRLTRERGVALMFDIRVQNGGVDREGSGERIRGDFELINPALSADEQEVARMEIIARDRAEVASPKWREDVLRRKLTIAQGKGTVHGRSYDLDRDFAIGLDPIESTAPLTAVA